MRARPQRPASASSAGARRWSRVARSAGVLLLAGLLTTACAAGRDAQTDHQLPTQDGVNAQVGNIAIRGLSIAAPSGLNWPAGSDVFVNLVLVNTGTANDTLTGISTGVAKDWASYSSLANAAQVQAAAGVSGVPHPALGASQSVTIQAQNRVSYGVPDATGGLLLLHTTQKIWPGNSVTMRLSFSHAGSVKVTVPVQLSSDSDDRAVTS